MNSKKIYMASKYQDIQIPLMSVPISNDRSKDKSFEFFLYDTSGEHGLPANLNRKIIMALINYVQSGLMKEMILQKRKMVI